MFIRTMLVAGSLSLVGCAGGDDGSQSTTTSQFPAATAQAEQTNLDETGVAIPDLAPGETPIGPYYDGIYNL
ncbi:MAG: hypothetical protein IH940_14085, partial [Acidobacteria bacterium]|nr:hypothetical protein [Acidobacteriota bacterium]